MSDESPFSVCPFFFMQCPLFFKEQNLERSMITSSAYSCEPIARNMFQKQAQDTCHSFK
jgi:hypothetical protein